MYGTQSERPRSVGSGNRDKCWSAVERSVAGHRVIHKAQRVIARSRESEAEPEIRLNARSIVTQARLTECGQRQHEEEEEWFHGVGL